MFKNFFFISCSVLNKLTKFEFNLFSTLQILKIWATERKNGMQDEGKGQETTVTSLSVVS